MPLALAEDDPQRLVAPGGEREAAVVPCGIVLLRQRDLDGAPLGGGLGGLLYPVKLGGNYLLRILRRLNAVKLRRNVCEDLVTHTELERLLVLIVRHGDDMQPHKLGAERRLLCLRPSADAKRKAQR